MADNIQLKKDYLSGVGDSLDLVVVGAYHGKGKRTAVYGAFLLACYDPDSEHFQTICKIGTGFSEEILTQFYELLQPLEIQAVRGDIEVGGAKPDVWFEPKIVWEVLTADLSLSPVYTAAHGLVSYHFRSLKTIANRCRSRAEESRYDSLDSSKSETTNQRMKRQQRNKWASFTKGRSPPEAKRTEVETTSSGSRSTACMYGMHCGSIVSCMLTLPRVVVPIHRPW